MQYRKTGFYTEYGVFIPLFSLQQFVTSWAEHGVFLRLDVRSSTPSLPIYSLWCMTDTLARGNDTFAVYLVPNFNLIHRTFPNLCSAFVFTT